MRWSHIALFLLSWASAQVQDDFSDGDFTHNPPWSGTDLYWSITPDYRLRSNGPAATATLYLSTPNTLISHTEWRFWVRVGFNPSTQNYVRIYLVADRANLSDPSLNGYYLRLGGITGNLDSLELWRQQGATHTRVAGGRAGRFGGTNNILRVRVLRDGMGNWEAYTDSLGFWEAEFTAVDAVLSTTTHFGVYFQHTSTNRQNLWLDDIYVGPPIVDTTPPQVVGVEILLPTQLRLTFSEAVTVASSTNISAYTVTPGPIPITTATRPLPTRVELSLGQPLQPSTVYTLSYAGVEDMAGNAGSGSLQIVLAEEPAPGDVVFSELMPKPTPIVSLPAYEYVELYNRSTKWIQVGGLRFCDAVQCASLGSRLLPPGGYLLLIPSSAASAYPSGLPLSSWPTLNDSGDSLTLWNAADERLDFVYYRSSWYRDPTKAQGGWSLERIDLDNLCATDSNWTASAVAAGGTPGAVNSVAGSWTDQTPPSLIGWEIIASDRIRLWFSEVLDTLFMQALSRYSLSGGPQVIGVETAPTFVTLILSGALQGGQTYTLMIEASDCEGNRVTLLQRLGLPEPVSGGDVIFSEVMPKPTPSVGLPPQEYVELYNRSGKWVDVEGWQLCDGSLCATLPPRVLEPGAYLLLVPTGAVGDFPGSVGLSPWPTLNDTEDSLSLWAVGGQKMDELQYRSSWYRDPVKAQGGWSLERIDLDNLCATDSNWKASIASAGGTPATPNSVVGSWRDTLPPSLDVVSFRSVTELLLRFSEPVDTLLMRDTARYRVIGGPSVTAAIPWSLQEVQVVLSVPLSVSTEYELEVLARDCMGNESLLRYSFGLPAPASPFDVVITEIMADPDPPVGLPPFEYIELHNRSQKYIDLQGWALRVGTFQRTFPAYLLRPGAYVVLSSVEGAFALGAYGPSIGFSSFPAVPNAGSLISLRNAGGDVIDEVRYADSWYGSSAKREGGWSLERIWVDWLCGEAEGWKASESPLGGTPGRSNSVRESSPFPSPRIVGTYYVAPLIRVSFSERMDTARLRDVSLYELDPPVPFIAATPIGEGGGVELLPMTPLEENREYRLRIEGLLTCAANGVDTLESTFYVPAPLEPGDVVINEILPEPQTGGARYVEVYNRSDKFIDLSRCLLARGAIPYSHRVIGGESLVLHPGGYLCLTADTADIRERYVPPPFARLYQIASLPAYDYSRDIVWLLRRGDSVAIDRVPYAASYHFPDLRSRKGVALERLSPERPSDDPQNWYSAASSVRFGTPGYRNSQREFSDGEGGIRLEPKTFSPDGDGYEDLVWIYVPADAPDTRATIEVHTVGGYKVCTVEEVALLAVGENRFRWEGIDSQGRRLPAGVYIVTITVVEPTRGKVRRHRLPCAIAERMR
ncbi:MAG: lamin tail domain-containing protein [Bacteroidia bacterium]|nr:lamin tail domain-containing protein [Bacteroidia bacterium]